MSSTLERQLRDVNEALLVSSVHQHELTELAQKAEAASARLAAIVDYSDDAIIGTTLDGVITSWNRSAEKTFGYTAAEALGQYISLIIPAKQQSEEDNVLAHLRRGEKIDHFETEFQAKDGRRVSISLTVSPIKDAAGRIIGASKVARDITERKQTEKRIYDLLTELREADRRKDEFLATLAHELRNPLAPIRNALQIMRLAGSGGAAAEQARTMMERQLTQMVRLVDDLLDVSRITWGKVELRKERVELTEVVQSAVETSRPLIEASCLELTVILPPEPIPLDADLIRLAQVFSNLLNNASRYTEQGGHIWLTAELASGGRQPPNEVVIMVRDTGIGIPADMLPKVFEMFTQVDRSLERSQGGLGVGLTLVKRLVEMHGGSVEARSDGPGKGSEFIVRLPVAVASASHQPEPVKGEGEKAAAPAKRRILVVDDNKDSADSLSMMLSITGMEIRTAYDGFEAVEVAAAFNPDVVLLDIGLPKLNGYDAARRIREEPWGKDMVLVAVTGWGKEEDRRRSQEAGFNFHMVKPVDPAALQQLLAALK